MFFRTLITSTFFIGLVGQAAATETPPSKLDPKSQAIVSEMNDRFLHCETWQAAQDRQDKRKAQNCLGACWSTENVQTRLLSNGMPPETIAMILPKGASRCRMAYEKFLKKTSQTDQAVTSKPTQPGN